MRLINQQVYKGVALEQRRMNLYGIEIELENYRGQTLMTKDTQNYWNQVSDPSLRQGIELVSLPLSQTAMKRGLTFIQPLITDGKFTASSRCGVHIHVNMLNVTWGQMWSFIALYTLLEPEIFAKFAKDRYENHFCVPVYWNTQMCNDLGRDINVLRRFSVGDMDYKPPAQRGARLTYQNLGGIVSNDDHGGEFGQPPRNKWFPFKSHLIGIGKSKYGSLTTYRIPDLGTVEIRILPGTTDMNLIKLWLEFIARLKYQSMKYTDPLQLQNDYETNGPDYLWRKFKVGPRPRVESVDKDDAEESAYKLIGLDDTTKNDYEWNI